MKIFFLSLSSFYHLCQISFDDCLLKNINIDDNHFNANKAEFDRPISAKNKLSYKRWHVVFIQFSLSLSLFSLYLYLSVPLSLSLSLYHSFSISLSLYSVLNGRYPASFFVYFLSFQITKLLHNKQMSKTIHPVPGFELTTS